MFEPEQWRTMCSLSAIQCKPTIICYKKQINLTCLVAVWSMYPIRMESDDIALKRLLLNASWCKMEQKNYLIPVML